MAPPNTNPALKHLEYLDGWRGLAILLLLIGHFLPVPGINLGAAGVNFFFVLSGYLMGQLLFIKHTDIPTFYKRRGSRILPAHALFIVGVVAFLGATGRSIRWNEVGAALLMINNYYLGDLIIAGDLDNTAMLFGHVWSLCVEEHSYILLSLVAIASRNRWVNARWAIACIAACLSAAGFWYWSRYSGPALLERWIHSEVSAYGIFVSTLLLLAFAKVRIPRLPAFVYALLIGSAVALHWWSVPAPLKTTLGVGILALVVNLLPAAPSSVKNALSFKPLRVLGLWSFSLYLWQQPFYLAFHAGRIAKPTAILLAFACGTASFYLLERPARAYLNRVWGATTPRSSPGLAARTGAP